MATAINIRTAKPAIDLKTKPEWFTKLEETVSSIERKLKLRQEMIQKHAENP